MPEQCAPNPSQGTGVLSDSLSALGREDDGYWGACTQWCVQQGAESWWRTVPALPQRSACTLSTEAVSGGEQVSWSHWTLGFAVRMCLVCVISARAWRLGTVGSV